MEIAILGAESLGVRSLCTRVRLDGRTVLIDPGVALDRGRGGLLPHPVQVAACEQVRARIVDEFDEATDVVVSHYHGDHVPLVDADCYQIRLEQVRRPLQRARSWCKGPIGLTRRMARRRHALERALGSLPTADEGGDTSLAFSAAFAHGEPAARRGRVIMTRVCAGHRVFVHASDIQLLDDAAVDAVLAWEPDLVLVAGPPLYLSQVGAAARDDAFRRTVRLGRQVHAVVIDHHLLRSDLGLGWLRDVGAQCSGRVQCAADFMGVPPRLLEADRKAWYRRCPVRPGWHRDYACGRADTVAFAPPGK